MEPQEPTFQRVGRYELIRKIATGGMAELFLARFTGPGGFEKKCAVKRILPQFAEDAEFTRMFLNEARIAALFDHPNIAQIFELGTDERTGQHFIAMELINGMDLRQMLRLVYEQGKSVPPELAAYLMTQALDGLAYAHEFRDQDGVSMRVVHRDVSPQNILVSFDGAIKLVDFGIVKVNSAEGHTQSGMLKGKVAYMAPEQAAGDPVDARSDVWAIGVCLYELVTGVKPFRGTNEVMTLKAILEQPPQPLTHLVPECPEGIEEAIYRAVSKAPTERFQSARDFQVELLKVLRACPVPLDRHVVAQFVRSLTEGETSQFSSDSLKIGRVSTTPTGPRFAAGVPVQSGPPAPTDEAWRAEAAMAFRSALDPSKRRGAPSVFKPVEAAAMAPAVASNTDSGVFPRSTIEAHNDADMANMAGLGGRRSTVFMAATALMAALGVLALTFVLTTSGPSELVTISTAIEPEPSPPASSPAPVLLATPSPSRSPAPSADPARVKEPERRTKPRSKDPEPGAPAAATGRLTLATQPRGLTVKLDDKVLGTTPLDQVPLPPGKHTLTVSSAKLGIARALTVEIKRDEVLTKTLTVPRGNINIKARPYAEVYIDGQHVGTTPLTRPVYEGRHEVKLVSSEGHGEQIRMVDVSAEREVSVAVKF